MLGTLSLKFMTNVMFGVLIGGEVFSIMIKENSKVHAISQKKWFAPLVAAAGITIECMLLL